MERMLVLEGEEPLSPTGQYFNSSVLPISILAVFEIDTPIDDSQTIPALESMFLPISPRFSSIVVKDDKGNQYWRRVEVKLADHVYVPVFPDGEEYYDGHLHDYLTKIASEGFPQNRPLWDLHLIKYPTHAAAGTMVFRLQHALGDGFSLIGALFQGFRRADNPSLPLTLPTAKPIKEDTSGCRKLVNTLSMCVNTVHDFGFGLLKSKMLADNPSPIRSGDNGVEFRPIMISTVEFSLDHIQLIKKTLGATVNDVITGTVFYGVHLYIQAVAGTAAKSAAMTAMILLNTRVIGNYPTTIKEMTKPNTKSPWGNHFGFMHIALPSCSDPEAADPLGFVLKAKEIIKTKRNSLGIYLTARLLEMIRRRQGPEAAAKVIHQSLRNSSLLITNVPGPKERMVILGHQIRSLYFMVAPSPQSLTITVMSYNGKVKIAMGTEKGFIDAELLKSCLEKSFQRISKAAAQKRG